MIESTPPLLPLAGAGSANALTPLSSPAASSSQGNNFQSLLGMMLMSGNGMGAQGSGMVSDLLTPLMLLLLEQLLSRQVNQTTSPAAAATASLYSSGLYPPAAVGAPSPTPWGLPVTGRLTQKFHASHNGLDFGIPVGTPVRSTMDGTVVYAGWNDQGYGNLVIVENGPYRTYYAHLSSVPVSLGQQVSAGTVIGLSGNTGNSTGPHLHYEIRINKQAIDPTELTLNRPPRW